MNSKSILAVLVLALAGGAFFWMQSRDDSSSMANGMEINFGNNSYDKLKTIELSPAGQDEFTLVTLEPGGLGGGKFYKYAIVDGNTICTYDLRFTKDNGEVSLRPGVDLCSAPFYHFEDDK